MFENYGYRGLSGLFPMRLVCALSPSGVQNKSLVHSYFSGVNSLADTYQRAAGFGVTSAHSNLLGHVSYGLSLSGAILT